MKTAISSKVGIDLSTKDKTLLFKTEISDGINWLINAYDDINKGWGYLPEIPVNVQNTSEVLDTLINCYENLRDDDIDILKDAIDAWLLDINNDSNPKMIDTIWSMITLSNIRNHIQLFDKVSIKDIDNKIVKCLGTFFMSQNEDGGWGDSKGDVSSVTRTSMVLVAMNKIIFEPTDYQKNAIEKAVNWILKMQNQDGGWGNINKDSISNDYIRKINLSYKQLEQQYLSNAAATGYAMQALKATKPHAYKLQLNHAAEYLFKTQDSDGHWELFTEFSLNNAIKMSFRHQSTCIALKGLLSTYSIEYSSEVLINGIDYLISLQDPVYKGWKASPTSESYTWVTCNVLTLFMHIKKHFERIKANEFMAIIKEWWGLKQEKEISVFKTGKKVFSFNKSFGTLFCITFTLLMFTWIVLGMLLTNHEMIIGTTDIAKIVKAIIVITFTMLIGVPWTIYIKSCYREMEDSWFNTIGWVYGIIFGVLLAFFGFFI